jgi:chaperone required for assembly of F1-ATPase
VKRFYKDASYAAADGGYALLLDGRPVKTPTRNALVVPHEALAEAIAGEWRAQEEVIDPRAMPLTGLANAAIDRIAPEQAAFAAGLAVYGESDLLCYRAEGPERLVERQAEHWDPILTWARRRYDIELKVTGGILHQPQPPASVERLVRAVAARNAFELAGLSPLVTVSGSLVIALAVAERAIAPEQAWDAASLDEQWQIELWGDDAEAVLALANRKRDFEAGVRFLGLVQRG